LSDVAEHRLDARRLIVRQGFLLVLLSLLGGIAAPYMFNARMGTGAHIIGFLGGMMLILLGLARPLIRLEGRLWQATHWSWLGAMWCNWIAATLAGLTGASRLTPIAGAGTTGSPFAEAIVFALFCVVGVTSLLAAGLTLYGLRPR
jgi:hydroxylaminobenzene mutase